ncbi:MAG: xanthine phosphoribosyltransferase [Ruminococcaceae bacterium]|nr:xanthine phosphoribosyltransferase [Oscillospiraceae bacterium]
MELLKKRILADGEIRPGNILKVDSFLNQRMDIALFNEMGKEFKKRFADEGVTVILTVEASGIGVACIAAQYFDCPVVFAKKYTAKNLDSEVYSAKVHSYTKDIDYTIRVTKKYIKPEDKVLIIDDFLATGEATNGMIDIVKQAGATLAGVGIVIEKGFQNGGKELREQGVHLESLAIVKSMSDDSIEFA